MKTRALILCALVLLAASRVQADGYISLVEDSSAHDYNCHIVYENTTATLELGLFDPVNPAFGNEGARPVENVAGFECKLIPHEGIIILGVHYPVPAIDIGEDGELIVGYGEPVPVAEYGKTVLATVDVFFGGETSFELPEEATMPCYMEFNTWIQVTSIHLPSIPGSAAYLDADDPFDPLVAAEYNEGPDFKFHLLLEPTVSSETLSWEGIKTI